MSWLDAVIQGVLLGGLYALFAAGLSLIFGIMRLVNLAHGDLVVLGAFVLHALVHSLGLGIFGAFVVGAVVMSAVGYALQYGVFNRVLGKGVLPPLVTTFGLSIIIQNGLLQAFSADSRRLDAASLEIASLRLGGGLAVGVVPLLTFVGAVLVIAALRFLSYSTRIGRAFRATSDDLETAQLMGIDTRRISAVAMAVSMLVALIAALFLGVRSNFDPSAGPTRLVFGFEAVIIGGLGNLWGTLAGGILLGVAQTLCAHVNPEWQALGGHVAFLVVLVVRPHGLFPRFSDEVANLRSVGWRESLGRWLAMLRARDVLHALRRRSTVAPPRSRLPLVGVVTAIALLAALPAFASRSVLQDLIFVFYMLALAQYWNLLAGRAGLVSVGQHAFVGLGGYLLFALTIIFDVDPILAIPLVGVISAVSAVPMALVVFRLRGHYFAVGTWVLAEVLRLLLAKWKRLSGGSGQSLPVSVGGDTVGLSSIKSLFDVSTAAAREIATYWTALGLAVGTVLFVYVLLRSRHGLALGAIRDSETAAESVGVDSMWTKLWVYVLSAGGTGMVGALVFFHKARISPDAAFSVVDWTAYVLVIVVIGGIGTMEGPFVGVLVFYAAQTYLAQLGAWYLILLGAITIGVMLFAPSGLWGWVADRSSIGFFPTRRKLGATAD